MNLNAAKQMLRANFLAIALFVPSLMFAQAGMVLSGTVTDGAGKAVPGAHVSASSAQGGPSTNVTADAGGKYSLPSLPPGIYAISVSAEGFTTKQTSVTLGASGTQTLDVSLAGGQELPNAPGAVPASPPSLQDLGFSSADTQSNPAMQATLNKRTEMLKIHQRLGLITAIPMAATLITGPMAKAKGKNGQTITEPTNANLDFHAALGGATTVLYFTTAYYAMFAPRVPGTHKHGAIRVHEALAFIHGPGMILTPVLGAMAYKQEEAGEKVHGIASAHGTVAVATAMAYGASIIAVSWPIHLKFWEKK